MTVFRSAAADWRITGDSLAGGAYATARATGNYSNGSDNLRAGQSYSSSHYYVYRSFLIFDTSAIPDGDTVTAVTLGLKISADYTTTSDFTLYFYKYNWKTTPIDDVYDMGIAGATDGIAAAQETPTADVTGKVAGNWVTVSGLDTTWINKTGNTKYALRSNRDADGSGTAPTGAEYLNFYSGENVEADRPYLDVTHGTGGATRITRIYAQGVLGSSPLNPL